MPPRENSQIATDLSLMVDRGSSASDIGEAIASTCEQIGVALAKVVGKEGVDAMFRRSLLLTAPTVLWDFHPPYDNQTVADLAPLRATFSHRSASNAASAGSALLQAFYESLANLIGRAHTERLLRPILASALHADR